MKFRKKPVVIEAVRFDSGLKYQEVMDFCGDKLSVFGGPMHSVIIHTLEGDMQAVAGDWIIKGVKGEFYPCKPDIFEMTYEKVEDET